MRILAIDIGTTNVKGGVFDEGGRAVSMASVGVPMHFPAPGSAVQRLDELYGAVVRASRGALRGARATEVDVVALSAQMHGLAAIDGGGRELLPLVTYLDTRASAALPSIGGRADPYGLYESTGCPPLFVYPLAKLVWLSRAAPRTFKEARWFVSAKDYVVFRMLGEPYVDRSVASGSQLLDIHRLTWSDLALSVAGIDEGRLPHLCDGERVLCELPGRAAGALGLSKAAPLVLGASDAALHSIGVGAVERGLLALNIGTSGAIRSVSEEPVLDKSEGMRFFCYYVGYGIRLPGGAVNNAGIGLRWLRDRLGQPEVAVARLLGKDPYDLLVKEAEAVGPTAERLLILPFFSGERFPMRDPHATCVIFGLTLRHGKAHLVRALMESCVYTLRWVCEAMAENGIGGRAIRSGGGGARSRLWRQIQADVIGLPVEKPSFEEASLLGAAMMGAVATGAYAGIREAVREAVEVVDVRRPIAENRERYDGMYDLFKRLYGALKGLYAEHFSLGRCQV